ncbi:hypothetical protein H6F96_31850 [Microcoleus sp. FACHB-53]|nr:hypothetical protein [Microcoleus sp. FACHB-53]
MTCPNCADTGIKLNPRVYVEWGNPESGTLPLTTTCEYQTTTEGQGADELHSPSAPTKTRRPKQKNRKDYPNYVIKH